MPNARDNHSRRQEVAAQESRPSTRQPTLRGFERKYRYYYLTHGLSDLRLVIAGKVVHMHSEVLEARSGSFPEYQQQPDDYTEKLRLLSQDFTKNNCALKNLMAYLYSGDDEAASITWPVNLDVDIIEWILESTETHKLAVFFDLEDLGIAIELKLCEIFHGGYCDFDRLQYMLSGALAKSTFDYLSTFAW